MNNKQSLELYTEILSAVVLYKNELSDLTLKDIGKLLETIVINNKTCSRLREDNVELKLQIIELKKQLENNNE